MEQMQVADDLICLGSCRPLERFFFCTLHSMSSSQAKRVVGMLCTEIRNTA